ncbi:hypothetical protein SPBRAN_330 [uncultured Candidatus Thioglobus sp.]|nr:hypothetical protein SPBRAN_330 [uncultured Candidatus Thioglobus sp.]
MDIELERQKLEKLVAKINNSISDKNIELGSRQNNSSLKL